MPTTVAGVNSALIGRVALGGSDLRLPQTGPACRVFELPLEIPAPPHNTTKTDGIVPSQLLPRPSIILFLERLHTPVPDAGFPVHKALLKTATVRQDPSSVTMATGEAPLTPPVERKMMQLHVRQAWALAPGAKAFDAVVTVRACGRNVGTTRISAIGGTTSPEWIDEQ